MNDPKLPGEQAASMLDRLGATSDIVAQTLSSLAIKGVPNAVRSLNPIVQYLLRMLTVEAMMVDIIMSGCLTITLADWRQEQIQIPAPVLEFLDRFDRGDYPELLAPST